MTDKDGLYIDDILVSSADKVSTTYQGNDLTKPASLQTNYSNSFSVPDTLAFRKLTGNAEQLDSGSKLPYNPLSAKIIQQGETIFDGIAELSDFQAGWEVALYEEKKDLFTRIDRTIKKLKLDELDHPWTIEEINARSTATEGVFYPFIDYGLLKEGVQPYDTMFPAVFVKNIIAQLLEEEGYTIVGDILVDEVYKRLFIPFSESEPTNYDEQWQTDRFARVTTQRGNDEVDRGTLGKGYWIDRVQEFNLDNIDTFYQGALKNYNTKTYTYVCDQAMNLKVETFQIFKALAVNGSVEIILSIEKNGQKIENARFESGSYYNMLFSRTDKLSLASTVKCKAKDEIKIRLEARRQTSFGAFHILIYNDPDNAAVSFTPELTTSLGDMWKVARNLPDMSGKSLMVAIAYECCGTWLVDRKRKQVEFAYFNSVVDNVDNAVDWSNRLNTGVEPKWVPRIEPFGQTNLLTWKEIDETKKAAKLVGTKLLNYGDGIINVNAPVLEPEVPLFEMPFAASTDSTEVLPGYGSPPLVKIRTVSGRGDNLSINKQDTAPRLLLASLDDPIEVDSSRIKDDGVTVEKIKVKLRPCWFGVRPEVVNGPDTQFTLSFGSIGIGRGEVTAIDRYYPGLLRVLRRMRVLTATMRLKPSDIAKLDFKKPIRLQRVQVGALTLSDGYYYLNKVADYQSDNLANVTLIAF